MSPASAVRWHEAFVRDGRTRTKPMGGDQGSHAIEANPELFLHELRARLAEHGLRVGVSRLSRFIKRHGITRRTRPETTPSRIGRT